MSTSEHRPPLARQSRATPGQPCFRTRGFTMVEMMVVMALIGILAVVIGISLSGGGQALALGNGQRSLLLMIQAARASTQRQKTRARLIIFADKNHVPDTDSKASSINPKVLRAFGVIYAESDDPTLAKQAGYTGKPFQTWVAGNDGAMLPDGIYFVPSQESAYAKDVPSFAADAKNNALTEAYSYPQLITLDIHPGTVTGVMQINYPLQTPATEGTGDYYYFIEFAPDGFFYNTNGNNNLFLGTAVNPTDDTIDFRGTGDHPNLTFTGVQLRMLGGAAAFRSSDDFAQSNSGGK